MLQDDEDGEMDDGFGPGSDLVLSFLGIVLLLIGVTLVTGLPKAKPAAVEAPTPQAVSTDVSQTKALERLVDEWKQRAQRAEGELQLARAAARSAAASAAERSLARVPNRVVSSDACQVLLSRSTLGDPLSKREHEEIRSKCLVTK